MFCIKNPCTFKYIFICSANFASQINRVPALLLQFPDPLYSVLWNRINSTIWKLVGRYICCTVAAACVESSKEMRDIAVDMPLDFLNLTRGLAGWQYTRIGTPSGFMKNSGYQS